MNEILSESASTILNEPIKLNVDIRPVNSLHKKLQQWKVYPLKREFSLSGITMGALIRISKELLSIDISVFDKENLLESNYKSIHADGERIAKIIAIAVTNAPEDKRGERSLIKFILRNFTSKEMLQCLQIVLRQMDVTSFMSSIISVKGLNILQMSPGTEEIIASGK